MVFEKISPGGNQGRNNQERNKLSISKKTQNNQPGGELSDKIAAAEPAEAIRIFEAENSRLFDTSVENYVRAESRRMHQAITIRSRRVW